MNTLYQLTVCEQSGAFYEVHRHHNKDYLIEIAEVYQKHGYTTTINVW